MLAQVPSKSLRVITWNARSLVHYDASTRKKKFAMLKSWIDRGFIVLLQEVHGSPTDLYDSLQAHQVNGICHSSLCVQRDKGGVAVVLPV